MTCRSMIVLVSLGLWLAIVPVRTSLTHDITGGDRFGNTAMPNPAFTLGDDTAADPAGDSVAGISYDVIADSLAPEGTPYLFDDVQFSLLPGDGFSDVVSAFGAAGHAVTAAVATDGVPLVGEALADDDAAAIPFAASGIPHPASLALLGAGLLGFQAVRRRRQPLG